MMQQAIVLVSGAAAFGALPACAPRSGEGPYFSTDEMNVLREVGEIMIPATDTPGAEAAGVHDFIDGLMRTWASDDTREAIRGAVHAFDAKARAAHNMAFTALDPARKAALVAAHDAESFDAPQEDEGAEAYRRLKGLVFHGYYMSEIGATQELQWVNAPGPDARRDAPLAEVGRTWAEQ
jgi:hypothetical protein